MKIPPKPRGRKRTGQYPLATWPRPLRDMWHRYTSEYQITDEYGRHLLGVACVAFGELLDAQKLIETHGMVVKDRFGQLVANPACAIARGARFGMLSALRALNLDVLPQGKPGPSSSFFAQDDAD